MVKSPRIRHSKPRRDPVTIDLEAREVKEKADASEADTDSSAAGATSGSEDLASLETGRAAEGQPEAKPRTSGPTKPDAVQQVSHTATSQGPAKPGATGSGSAAERPQPSTGPASAAGSSAFGRAASKPSSTPPPASPPRSSTAPLAEPARPRRSIASTLIAGFAGAVLALLGIGVLQFAGILPTPSADGADAEQVVALRGEIAALREQVQSLPEQAAAPGGLAERVDALAAALDQARTEFTAGAAGQTDPAAMQALDERFAALEAALAELPAAGAGAGAVDLAPLDQKIAAVEASAADAAKTAADAAAAVQAAGERIGQVEQTVAGLSSRLEEQAEQPQAALAIAASSLKAAIDRGEAFTTELDTFAAVAPDAPEIETLRGMAADGVPSRTQIAAGFDEAAAAMLAAGRTADPNAGIIDKLMSSAQSLVQVRPVGEVQGEDAPAAVARMEVAIEKGDYETALKEYESLPEASKAAGAAYAADLRARLAADGLMDKVLAAALKA